MANAADSANRLILVMGAQRSGTTALLESFSQDPELYVEDESAGPPFYLNYRLRSPTEIATLLRQIPRRVVLKPVAEMHHRSLEELVEEYAAFAPRVAWIYRDPIANVVSAQRLWNLSKEKLESWVNYWVATNQSALACFHHWRGVRLSIVRYEEVISHPDVFDQLCVSLDVRPEANLFFPRSNPASPDLSPEAQDWIRQCTDSTLAALDRHRIMPVRSWTFGWKNPTAAGSALTLETHTGAEAHVDPDYSAITGQTVKIDALPKQWLGAVRVLTDSFDVVAGHHYRLSLRVRAQAPRKIGLGIDEHFSPEAPLFVYRDLELSSSFREVVVHFEPEVSSTLRASVFMGNDPSDIELDEIVIQEILPTTWELVVATTSDADVQRCTPTSEMSRVTIERAGESAVDILLSTSLPPVVVGRRYRLSFIALAPSRRTIGVGVVSSPETVGDLGFYREIPIDVSSQRYSFEFVATSDCENVLFVVHAGGSLSSFEIGFVRLVLIQEAFASL